MTPYAVATDKEARDLRTIRAGYAALVDFEPYLRKGWMNAELKLTPAGHVALGMREVLGFTPRDLSESQVRRLLAGKPTPAKLRRFVELGLMNQDRTLTEDGRKIKVLLRRHGVSL